MKVEGLSFVYIFIGLGQQQFLGFDNLFLDDMIGIINVELKDWMECLFFGYEVMVCLWDIFDDFLGVCVEVCENEMGL